MLLLNVFLYFYENKFNGVNFFHYIDDLIVFNCNNFEEISREVYPKGLTLNHTNTFDSILFLDLKTTVNIGSWFIDLYNKRNDFNFKVNCLTNWFSCITRRILKNILFLPVKRICNMCNNDEDWKMILKIWGKKNYILTVIRHI